MTRFLAPAILVLALTAGSANAEVRNLTGFTGIGARDGVEVVVTTGPTYRVEVTGRDTQRVRTRINNGTLEISHANRPWWGDQSLHATVRVTLPRLESLGASRGAQIEATNITARNITIAAAMGGVIEISGACAALDASASMGGVLNAERLECATADVSASMGGTAEVFASSRYDASASMGGTIDVAGAGTGESSSSMGGDISHSN